MSTPHKSETNGIVDRKVRRIKEGTSAVLLQSGPDNEWWEDSMECYWYLRNTQVLFFCWEITIWEAVRNTIQRTNNTVWSNGRISSYFCKWHIETASICSKSLARYIPRLCLVRGRNLESRHWRIGGDGRVWNPRQKEQCKGRVNADERWQFHIPSRRWNSQYFWRWSTFETIHINQGSSWTRRGTRSFSRRIRRTPSPTPLQDDSTRDDAEAKRISVYYRRFHLSPSRETQSQTVRAKTRIISYSVEVHRRYQKYTYITGCTVGENMDDYWKVDVESELSDAWTGFTRFILLNERPLDGFSWSG